jgi:peptide/nickel transport system ATP-binding protein
MSSAPLLDVQDLQVSFADRHGDWVDAVKSVSFSLGRERLGIVGESGSGKSQTGRAIMGLTPPEARVRASRMRLGETDLLTCSPQQRRELRGKRMTMVLQDPKFSLNPVMTIGEQIVETLQAHRPMNRAQAIEETLAALVAVQIDNPQRVFGLYPHEVSGGNFGHVRRARGGRAQGRRFVASAASLHPRLIALPA